MYKNTLLFACLLLSSSILGAVSYIDRPIGLDGLILTNQHMRIGVEPELAPGVALEVLMTNDMIDNMALLTSLRQSLDTAATEDRVSLLVAQKIKMMGEFFYMNTHKFTAHQAEPHYEQSLALLTDRIKKNTSLGNKEAVIRDIYIRATQRVTQRMDAFALMLYTASVNQESNSNILLNVTLESTALQAIMKDLPAITDDLTAGRILDQAIEAKVYADDIIVSYQDYLAYLLSDQAELLPASWLHYTDIDALIGSIDAAMGDILNSPLRAIGISWGKLIVAVALLLLTPILVGLLLTISRLFIRIVTSKLGHNTVIEAGYKESRFVVKLSALIAGSLFSGGILFRGTELNNSVVDATYIVLVIAALVVLFKILDGMILWKMEQISDDNQVLRHEMYNLGIKTVKCLLVIISFSLILRHFGISMGSILSALGIGGLAFALAAKDTLANFFGGMSIFWDNIFSQGEWVTIDAAEGDVVEIGLWTTTLRTFDNALITIPNAGFTSKTVKNWSRRTVGRRIKLHLPVSLENNHEALSRVLERIRVLLQEDPGISGAGSNNLERIKQFKKSKRAYKFVSERDLAGVKDTQLVYLDNVNAYAFEILVYCFTVTVVFSEWLAIQERVILNVMAILEEEGVTFAYPVERRIMDKFAEI